MRVGSTQVNLRSQLQRSRVCSWLVLKQARISYQTLSLVCTQWQPSLGKVKLPKSSSQLHTKRVGIQAEVSLMLTPTHVHSAKPWLALHTHLRNAVPSSSPFPNSPLYAPNICSGGLGCPSRTDLLGRCWGA